MDLLLWYQIIPILTWFFELVGAALIVYGGVKSAAKVLMLEFHLRPFTYNKIRIEFTSKIVFGLEFLIAADILATIISPTAEEIIMLAAVVIIRTIMGYFLEKEAMEFEIN